jgi:hypothetical protein
VSGDDRHHERRKRLHVAVEPRALVSVWRWVSKRM